MRKRNGSAHAVWDCDSLASQPYFSECVRMRVNKFYVGGEGKILSPGFRIEEDTFSFIT